MSNFFDKSDLSRKDVDEIVSETLKNCDDGEIYFENSKSESILLDDNKIKSSNYNSDLGLVLGQFLMKWLLTLIQMKYQRKH